jgi:hypothetical protein
MRGNLPLIWWPGLPQLWRQGSLRGLAEALAFSLLVNAAIGLTLTAPDLLSAGLRRLAWILVLAVWGVALVRQSRQAPPAGSADADDEGLFLRAQAEYLRGHWFEAEALLRERLRTAPQDCDAGLALASLFRRVGRAEEARHHLRCLARMPGAEKWRMEIERESQLLAQCQAATEPNATHVARQPADDHSRQMPPPAARAA